MKLKKPRVLGVLMVGMVLLLSLLWLQAAESKPPKGMPDTGNGKTIMNPPDYHNYPAYDPTPMRAEFGMTGLVTYYNSNGVAMINPVTKKISPILLNQYDYTIDPETNDYIGGPLGSEGGGRLDVAMTPNGRLALISNFGDSKVFFVNLGSGLPVVDGMAQLPFFAEDIAVSPNGKWALVTDGGGSSTIASVNIPSRQWIPAGVDPDTHEPMPFLLPADCYANAVAIASDNKTVIVADYFNGRLHVLLFNDLTGGLTYKQTVTLWKYGYSDESVYYAIRPVNVSISPDGRTVLAANASAVKDPDPLDPTDPGEGGNIAVFAIDKPGHIVRKPDVVFPRAISGGQSIVFSRDGAKAYYGTIHWLNWPDWDVVQEIQVLTVKPTSQVTHSGAIRMWTLRGTSQLFGVDTMAISPDGNFLYVVNPTTSGAQPIIEVADLRVNKPLKYITTPIDYPDPMAHPPTPPDPNDPNDWLPYLIPCGIAFPEGPVDLVLSMKVDEPNPAVGETVTFTVKIFNNGPGIAFDVLVGNDALPSGLTFVSATPQSGSYNQSTGFWSIKRINDRKSYTLAIKARVNKKGTFSNGAWIKNQAGYDPKRINNTAEETIIVE